MISAKEMRELEGKAFASGVKIEDLMEKAGKACADEIERRLGTGRRIAVFVGPGNNGGDGLVAARYLNKRNDVTVVVVKEPETDVAKMNYQKAKEAGVRFSEANGADIVVDALLGIGAEGPLRGNIKDACLKINQMKAFKVALDVPTGVDSQGNIDPNAILPDATICLQECKEGTEKAGGEIWVVDIGL